MLRALRKRLVLFPLFQFCLQQQTTPTLRYISELIPIEAQKKMKNEKHDGKQPLF